MNSNYYEFKIDLDEINLQTIEYRNPDNLAKFRADYPESSFMRYKDLVYIWPKIDFYHAKNVTIKKSDDIYLFNRLVSEPYIDQFFNRPDLYIKKSVGGFRVTDFRTNLSTEDFPFLSILRCYYLNFSPLTYEKERFGFSISSGIHLKLKWKEEDFRNNGLNYSDLTIFDSGEVKADSTALYRIAEYYGSSDKVKSLIDSLSVTVIEYQNCKDFVSEFFENQKGKINYLSSLDSIKVEPLYFKKSVDSKPGVKSVEDSKMYFYNNSTPKGKSIEYAMRSKIKFNKPVSYDQFENREINIGVVYPKTHYLKIANFIKAVQEELITIYRIPESKFKYTKFAITDDSLASYQSVFQDASSIDLAIVVVDEIHEKLSIKESPYYFCKAEFIKRGINSQEVQIQQVNKFLSDKATGTSNYADHTISLNIYAKLGGTAWTVKPQGESRNELVIGVGSTTDKEGKPQIGMTSVFRGDGKYLIGDISAVVGIDDYKEYLSNIIKKNIDDCLKIRTLDSQKPIYLVFHLFKKAGRYNEVDALQRVIDMYPALNIKYSFVYVGDGHNYRFYDFRCNSDQIITGLNRTSRGTMVKVNDNLSFLSLRKSGVIFSKIEVDSRSSIVDIEYLTKQVYDFSNLSHTSFNKQASPASIKYSKLMAKMSMRLKLIDGFYLSQISMPDNTPWFL